MNTNSIAKLSTLVSIFVVTVFTQHAFSETMEQCRANKVRAEKAKCTQADPVQKNNCLQTAAAVETPECDDKESKEDRNANDGACTDAYKKYQDGLDETNSACESVSGGSSSSSSSRYSAPVDKRKTCTDKINECAKMAASTSSQTEQTDGTGMASTINLFRQVIGGEESTGLSSAGSCLVDIDSKEAQDAEKDFRDRKKAITDEKKKIEDDAIKDKEDNDKEITRITKEIQELQRNNKETLAKADVKMREQLNASQKDLVDSAGRLRNLTTQISKKSDSVRALNFAYADRMMDSSTQKQNLRCKAALDQAKACMIKSAKGIADPACKDFPFTIKSKGPKATAELKAQLQVVNDACYEKEQRETKKLQFDQQEQLKKVSDEMTELQAQAKEEGERQQIQSENSSKIQQEAQREKDEASANMAEQIATLQGEMAQFAQKLQLKAQKTQERLAQLAQDLQKIELEEKTGKRSKTSYAQKAVRKTKAAFNDVIEQCKCVDASKIATASKPYQDGASEKGKRTCGSLRSNLPSGTETGGKKKSTSSVF